jgi:PST family polysaccharide transporter
MSGIGWTALGRVLTQVASFGLSVLLARLLTPADFGLLGITTVFTGFAALFAEMGFSAAIVQAREVEETHRSSVFWLNVGVGVATTVILAASSPLVAGFFSEPRLRWLMMALSLNFIIGSFSVVQRALLTRAMRFRALATVDTLSVVISGIGAVGLALSGWGVWSLVVQGLARAALATLLLWVQGGWHPRLHFRWASVRELLGYSAHLLGFNTLNYWVRNVDNLLIGRFFGSAELGIYTRAYSTMLLPVSQLTGVLGNVMFPALARIQDDAPRVKRAYLQALALIAFVTLPAMFGLAAVAHDFVAAVYGPRWARVAGVLQVLSIIGGLQSLQSTVGWLYRSQGRTDVLLRWGLFAGAFLVAGIGVGVGLGSIESVAICYAVANLLLTYVNFSVPGKYIGMRAAEVLHATWRSILSSSVMAGLVAFLAHELRLWGTPWSRLGLETASGGLLYAALAFGMNRATSKTLLGLVKTRGRKPAPSVGAA